MPNINATEAITKKPASLSYTSVNIIKPSPKTIRFDAKVKKLRKLLSLS